MTMIDSTAINPAQFTMKGLLVQQIRKEIIEGKLPPGTRLPLRQLADQFAVSVQPIREALSELEAEGLVQTIAHKGSLVVALSPEEIDDIYETRATLEALATRLAVPHLTEKKLRLLTQVVDDMDAQFGNVAELIDLNKQFHFYLYRASKRTHLCKTITTLRNRTSHYLHAYMIELGAMTHAKDDHRLILELCHQGDADGAANMIYDHISKAGIGIKSYVDQKGGKQQQNSE